MTYTSPPVSIVSWYFPVSVVFNASKATGAWVDLDLSGEVGVNSAWVMIKILNSTGGTINVRMRKNGDTLIYVKGVSSLEGVTNGAAAYVACVTDTTGKIEWYTEVTTGTIVLTLEVYGI